MNTLDSTEILWNENHVIKIPKYCHFQTVPKLQRFSLTHFWQKFRERNVFTKEITKELIWRNIFLARLNFSFFHTTELW